METPNVFFGIDDYMARFAPYIKRHEARVLAQGYVVGLMMDGDRKSVGPLSEKVHASERGMQRLLTGAKWDHEGAFCEYRRQMLTETDDPQRILLIDDTAFPKKGNHSVCVVRRYCGSLGKIDNCQIGVSMTYVGQGFAWPYAMELFVPQAWDNAETLALRKKTHSTDLVAPEDGNGKEQSCLISSPDFLKSWKRRQCPVRSSERWRERQKKLKHVSSLQDIRNQVPVYSMRMMF